MASSSKSYEPEGEFVTGPPAKAPTLGDGDIVGNHVTLTPLLTSHTVPLYEAVGGEHNAHLARYLPNDPSSSVSEFGKNIDHLIADRSKLFPYTILKDGIPVGHVCFLNIVPSNRSIEIGWVLFGESLQRTTGATEVIYLMIREAFNLGNLRVEWKANSLNEPSIRAALRTGFVHEGLFRKHMVVKGRRRDTWWGSIIDDEWFTPADGKEKSVKGALEAWLSDDNFEKDGRQKKKLEDFR